MKSKMKRRLRNLGVGLSWVALAGLPAGCLDLNEEIVTGVTASYFETEAGAQDAVRATYSYLREWLPRVEHWFSMTQFGTDIWLEGTDGQHKHFNRYDANLNAGAAYTTEVWNGIYVGINTANTAIARVDASTLAEATKTRLIAETRFLRGLMYLDLVRHWGDVHLTLEPSAGVVIDASRTPIAEVFERAIIPDLEFAAANLGNTPAGGERGRATRGAANHFLGIAYLTRQAAGDAERAVNALQQVVSSGVYSLEADYARTFELQNRTSPEIVFAVQFTDNPSAWGFGNRLHLYWGMVYDRDWPWIVRDIANGRPFRRIRPSPCLQPLWDRDVDVRYELSFKTVWFMNRPPPGYTTADTAIYLPGVDRSDAEIAAALQRNIALIPPRNYHGDYFPTLTKHLDPTRSTIAQEQSSRDFIIARYADTHLLLAEALIRAGRAADALPHVNAVRERAAKEGQVEAMRVGVNEMTLDFLLDERARELAGEGSEPRWFTLKRFGKLIERVSGSATVVDRYDGNANAGACNPLAAENIRPHHLLRPIPSTQIDRTNGGAAAFPQNPGY
jgi:starch-binding outer membrane protein, SusD/RagB family